MGNNWMVDIFSQILHMSITAGVIICMILGIRLCLRKVPKIFSYLLWSVVLFRLLCPIAAVSRFSVFGIWDASAVQKESTLYVTERALMQDAISVNAADKNKDFNEIAANTFEQESQRPIVSAAERADIKASLIWLGGVVWLIGLACIAGYGLLSAVCLKKKLAGAVCIKDNIYRSDCIDTPFTMGIFAPRIYLPEFLAEKENAFIILHEQTHIRRGDPAIKLLAFAAVAVHWFNPLVWIAFLAAEKDMEMSCDETVMKKMGQDIRAEYASSLLGLTTGKMIVRGMPLAFGEGNTKSRVKNIMRYKKPAAFAICIAAILVVICMVGFGTNPGGQNTQAPADVRQENTEAADADSTESESAGLNEAADDEETDSNPFLYSEHAFLGSFAADREWLSAIPSKANGEQVIYSTTADLNHDGIQDRIDLLMDTEDPKQSVVEHMSGTGLAYLKIYKGKADGSFEEEAFFVTGEVAYPHSFNGQIGLAKKDGQDYLLLSYMYEGQEETKGEAIYHFVVFYPDTEQETAVCVDESLVQFAVDKDNGTSVRAESLKEDAVADFCRRLDTWAKDAVLLISCDVDSDPDIVFSEQGTEYPASDYYSSVWKR